MTAPEEPPAELVEAVHAALVAVWADRPLVDYVPGHDEARAAIAAVWAWDAEHPVPRADPEKCPCCGEWTGGGYCDECVRMECP